MSSELETCLGISGAFEGGHGGARWDLVSGNFDGAGGSFGCLQWNPKTGSLQQLMNEALKLGAQPPDSYSLLWPIAGMSAQEGLDYALRVFIDTTTSKGERGPLRKDAAALWQRWLNEPWAMQAQTNLAQAKMDQAKRDAQTYVPWDPNNLRVLAFFFDVRVQQGGMSKKIRGVMRSVSPIQDASQATSADTAIALANAQGMTKTFNAWTDIVQQGELARILLHYAYERAAWAQPEYVWDTCSRRGTIACRQGGVHGKWYDLTQILP